MKKAFKICTRVLIVLLIIVVIIIIAALLFLNFYPGVGKTPDKEMQKKFAEKTDLFYDKQFHNENEFEVMTGKSGKTSSRVRPTGDIPVVINDNIPDGEASKLSVTWYGHSSVLVQLGEKNVLIDPVLSERTSPVSFAGPERFSDIALKPENVPEIDVLFISHDHYDHLDYPTIKAIDDRVKHYIVPLGIDSYLKGWGIDESKIHSLYWWESIELEGVTYTLTPSQHYTGRNPLKANITLWGGIHFKDSSHSVYYTGDGGYYDVFKRVYENLGEIDLIMADSGQYDKAWAMTHMNPNEAVQAAKDAHAKWLIPVHWGAFVLANHAWDEPPEMAVEAAESIGVNIATPKIGERVDYDNIESFTEHWWEDID